jgi:pyruvate dehydrogenase E1 component beta subunit
LQVVAPSNPADAKGLLKAAIRDPNPVVVLENEVLYGVSGPVPKGEFVVPIGSARIARSGAHVTVVSFARGMVYALDAAEILAEQGIEAEVIDLRSLRPLDLASIIESVKKTNRLVTVEEAWPVCSVGSEICAQVAIQAFDYLDAPPVKISGADVPMPYAANLERLALPSSAEVVAAVQRVCYA